MAASSTAVSPPPLLRERSRTSSGGRSAPPLPRRRSSVLSYASLDETRQSVTSSAGDYILPGLGINDDERRHDEPSHWHSSPLAFAILPAIGGLFFKDGSAFITDLLLLGFAAVFLNWSVRLPWQWYRSAQAVRYLPTEISSSALDEISEEESPAKDQRPPEQTPKAVLEEQHRAAAALRTHETLALLATFILPALGAYLLHVIRGQLSRPSTGLVSDYNLTIFLLAAEVRPCRQVIRLFTNRTLHLQRLVNGAASPLSTERTSDLDTRLGQLEAKVADQLSSPSALAGQHEAFVTFQTEVKKRYEPRLEALERAVRRYEKRATTLTLLTEQRLQSLEGRLQDALSLAAVAAQSSQKPGLLYAALTWLSQLAMVPVEAFWLVFVYPIRLLEQLVLQATQSLPGRKRKVRRTNKSVDLKKPSRVREDGAAARSG